MPPGHFTLKSQDFSHDQFVTHCQDDGLGAAGAEHVQEVEEPELPGDDQVALAPGHGLEDYGLGREQGLPVYSPVDPASSRGSLSMVTSSCDTVNRDT